MFSPRRKALKKGDENKERKRKAPMFHHKQSVFSKRFVETQPWAAVGTWFVGPKAENADIFKELMIEAIDSHFKFREEFYPCDPPYVTDQVREAQSFKKSMERMKLELDEMRKDLQKSVPFFSTRYKGHVMWDTAVPANLGYLATILWNQNNCIAEASPVTTEYELEAGSDLCEMIGFKRKDSMGHLVTGGSVANIEAMWMARNLKYYPLGLQEALRENKHLEKAKGYKIYLPQRENTPSATVPLVDATAWELLNLDTDTIVKMPDDVAELTELPLEKVTNIVDTYLYETIGPHEFYSRHNLKKPPCIVAASTYHVSFLKAVNIIGLGKDGLVLVPADENARMDCDELKRILKDKLANQIPVISVISIMGTTEESAVDPLVEILEIRKELRVQGLNFSIHADAAWGAYFRAMQVDPPKDERSISPSEEGFVPELSLNKHVTDQMEALHECDTITCDPHKSGFCPYPAGSICYRDKRLNSFLNLSIPPYYHGKTNLGTLAIEGSKPGAAASGVLLANKVIGLHKHGYGRILSECMFTSKIMYCYWVCLAEDDDDFVVETTKPLPNEIPGLTEDPKTFIKKNILGRSNEDIAKDPEVMEFLREIGPDTLIPCFSVNVRGNTDVDLTNKLVQAIFNALSHDVDSKSSQRVPLIVTSSMLTHTQHSTALKKFKERLGLKPKNKDPVEYIITTCLDPWSTSMEFMDDMAYIMRNTILNAIGTETDTEDYHSFVSVDKVNEKNEIFVCYAGNFKMTQHQYFVVARFKFLSNDERDTFTKTSDSEKKPIVLRNPEKKRLHDLLFNDSSQKFDFFVDIPAEHSVPFMTADMEMVDVPRYDHFDKADDEYPDNATYVMYGDVGNAYLFHVPTKDPDYLQVVSIGEAPKKGLGDDPSKKEMILKHGVDAELLGVPGSPTKEEGRIVDPLKKSEYYMNFVGIQGEEVTIPVAVQKKIWFDGEVLNKQNS